MISYTFYQKNPASHYIYIDLEIEDVTAERLNLQLPAWRPGRYELGNFAKNIKRVDVFDGEGNSLEYKKLSRDLWQVQTKGKDRIKVTYSYYAAELNAGSCFADVEQIYVNPVHCCMFVPGRMDEPHRMVLKVPETYRVGCALPVENFVIGARSYDQLADSPFIASATLRTESYEVNGHVFFLHFQGVCKPDLKKIRQDFSKFTAWQIGFWGGFPAKDYHFLFQITPARFYHGVEHAASTVIALGPGYSLNTGSTYEDLLGVSSHELFHAWNVKAIRPLEMLPYDFTRENYSPTGYVYEGFTTYYGDKLLYSSNVFSPAQYFSTLQERLQKHFHNFGRYNLSVADSSRDTWLDGYVPGAPYRKTSIYDEGSLIAFILDVNLIKATGNKKSLRDVCRILYERFGKKGRGYTDADIRGIVNEVSDTKLDDIFDKYVHAAADYTKPLTECFEYLGIQFTMRPAAAACERVFGFRISETFPVKITLVAPYSPAWKAGLFAGDEIIAVNGMVVRGNLNSWLSFFSDEEILLVDYISDEKLRRTELHRAKKDQSWFAVPEIGLSGKTTIEQSSAFDSWLRM